MAKKLPTGLKLALEYGPLAVFLLVFTKFKESGVMVMGAEYSGFILATAVLVPLMVMATGIQWKMTRHVSPMQIVTLVLVVGLGGLTVWLNDPQFIKMKPTLIYLLFAVVLGIGYLMGRNWVQMAVDGVLPLTPKGWDILTRRLIVFFVFLAVANEVVWRNFSESTWVYFKIFGLTALLFGFLIAQAGMISRNSIPEGAASPSDDTPPSV
ncbi:inner membrane-spanning protein YciB [Albirhodobacter sp. R86504]|jgi:intracellular septation protein|uniref:inner membrane-spanning protein YciB n=1 Tax=Albirhodobacter sp. R86504 TaxID=3093848 RepID=UPI00366C6525